MNTSIYVGPIFSSVSKPRRTSTNKSTSWKTRARDLPQQYDCWHGTRWSYSRTMLSWRLSKHKHTNVVPISWLHSDRLWTRQPRFYFLYRISSLRHHVQINATGPPNLPNEHRGLFLRTKSGRRVKPTIHLHLVTRSSMLGALLLRLLHVFMAFCPILW